MASNFNATQVLTAVASVLTAYTSATGLSTATFATSMSQQQTADTGLTGPEKNVITAITNAIGSAQPSSSIHGSSNLGGSIDGRTLFTAIASVLTALTSAQSLTTANVATQLSSQINVDTGLSKTESTLVTLFTSAIGNTQPSSSTHGVV